VKTLVVSDLHLGGRSGIELLGRPEVFDALARGLDGVDHLVLLGDLVELREGPVAEALTGARPVLERLGAALGDRRVTVVPGNHDHRLMAPWLERRRATGEPERLESRMDPGEASPAARAIAGWLEPARVEFAYPGIWLADGIYATHGHYLDRHLTVPTFESLGLRLAERVQRQRGALPQGVDGYEAILAPVFGLIHELAQTAPAPRPGREELGPSGRAFRVLSRTGQRSVRERLIGDVAFPAAVAALNSMGLGPVKADISGGELRRSSLRAVARVVEELDIAADHVIFGHTHRAGPGPGDDLAEWAAPGGARLHNCGSWVIERFLGGPMPQKSPYAAGGGIYVEDGELRLTRLWRDESSPSATAPSA
jgi:predicted phosphodiesterase